MTDDTTTSSSSTATAPPTLPLRPGRWELDRSHSSVGFTIRHLGISKVRGTFLDVEAGLVVGPTVADTVVDATVALASIDTGNADRDAHVRSADLLDVARRPTMRFRSTGIRGAGGSSGTEWLLDGDLTIGEVTRPISFEVDLGGVVPFPIDDRLHAGFDARGELRRSEFGLRFGHGDAVLGDVVQIALDLQFTEPA